MGKEHLSRQFDADLDDIRMELLEMGGTCTGEDRDEGLLEREGLSLIFLAINKN